MPSPLKRACQQTQHSAQCPPCRHAVLGSSTNSGSSRPERNLQDSYALLRPPCCTRRLHNQLKKHHATAQGRTLQSQLLCEKARHSHTRPQYIGEASVSPRDSESILVQALLCHKR